MEVYFSRHAEEKFGVLLRHQFRVSKLDVIQTVVEPEGLDFSRRPLIIAQRRIDKTHYLRVVYKREENLIKIITFYPARISQYAKRTKQTKN